MSVDDGAGGEVGDEGEGERWLGRGGAVEEVGVEVPVVVRLEGNNAVLGREVLANSGLNIEAAESLTDAAQKVVAAAGGVQ